MTMVKMFFIYREDTLVVPNAGTVSSYSFCGSRKSTRASKALHGYCTSHKVSEESIKRHDDGSYERSRYIVEREKR